MTRLSFPDAPRGQLDKTLADLVSIAESVLATQGRLRALVKANQAVVQDLDLHTVLRRIVEAGVELVDAQYGALGVIAEDGTLAEFIHVGVDDATAARIGHLPEGHGLLGALIDDPRSIRLDQVDDDERSVGFPAHHPAMGSFLGVPIRVRDQVFGNLYLTESRRGSFTEEDEQLAESLAATAGFAIDNARLFALARRREEWSAAAAAVTTAMLSSAPGVEPMELLVSSVLGLADADLACVVSPGDDAHHYRIGVARGAGADAIEGRVFAAAGSMAAEAVASGHPVRRNERQAAIGFGPRELGPTLAIPLTVEGAAGTVLYVARAVGAAAFDREDLDLANTFAGQAGVALELARTRKAEERLILVEDRGRIARDLHDHVIQQLFGTGLDIQHVAAGLADTAAAERLLDSVAGLDHAIAQIRTVIFALTTRSQARDSIRHRLIDIANDIGASMDAPPALSFSGPVDLVVQGDLASDVTAVVREALSNVQRHARASRTSVVLKTDGATIEVTIEDDGVGIASDRRSGLANLDTRARARDGALTVRSDAGGTRLLWTVPVPEETA